MHSSEDAIQASIVKWIKAVAPRCLVWHVPNGMYSNAVTVSRLKKIGLTAGAPDLIVTAPDGVTLFLEVKTENGRQSDIQKEWEKALYNLGHIYAVVRSIDDVRKFFEKVGITTREAA